METILNFLSSNYPMIGIFVVAAFIGGYVHKYHASIQSTKKKVDNLPCDENSKKIEEHELKLSSLPCEQHSQKLTEHSQSFEYLREILIGAFGTSKDKQKKLQISVFNRLSPFTLSDIGQKYLATTCGKECIDTNTEFFISELEKMQPQTAYDVEDYSERVLFRNTGSPMFKKIKDFVYLVPHLNIDGEKVDVSLPDVISVMGIYLRDKYLNLHPELIPELTTIPE